MRVGVPGETLRRDRDAVILFRHPLVGKALAYRPMRFLLVGGLNTIFGYGAFATLLFLGLGPSVALTLATILGVAFNFVTSGSLTFGSRDMKRLPAFCLTYGILFVLDLFALHGLVLAGVRPAIGQAALVLPLAALSYVIQRDLVFRIQPHGRRSV